MLKGLAILGVFLAVVQATMSGPGIAAASKLDAVAHKNGDTHSKNQQSITAAPSASQQVCSPTLNRNPRRENGKDDWDKAAVFSNYLLVLVGVIGIAYAACTFGMLKEQTKASKDAAEAALMQTGHIVAAERAWLLLDGDKLGPLSMVPVEQQPSPKKQSVQCQIALKNFGNTPAWVIDWQLELQVGESSKAPPSLRIFEGKPTEGAEAIFSIGPGGDGHTTAVLEPQKFINLSEKAELDNGSKFLWLCGVVRYYDAFSHKEGSNGGVEERRTFICARYVGGHSPWVLGGPSGYNKAT